MILLKRISLLFAVLILSSMFFETAFSIVFDGNNNFSVGDALQTTSTGYTNWIFWDTNILTIGYYGADLNASDPNTMVLVYISTNSNTGSAYGEKLNGQQPVLPFKADFIFQYKTSFTYDSAGWDGTAWVWNNPLNISAGDVLTNDSFMEFQIFQSNMNNSPYLDMYVQMVNPAKTYGAVPSFSLTDGLDANPSGYLNFGTNIWITNLSAGSNIYESYDTIGIFSNTVLYPQDMQTNFWGELVSVTNYAEDTPGLYKIEFYTNSGILYTAYPESNLTEFVYNLNTASLIPGINYLYTIAYDTTNLRVSSTNTLEINTVSDLSITKTVDSIILSSTNLLLPGSQVNFKIAYSNPGPGIATNIVIYDQIPAGSTYFTNYLESGTTGWEIQYAHTDTPADQTYSSADYNSTAVNVKWIRWRKPSIMPFETNKAVYVGITVD